MISTHILDTSIGKPASDVTVLLARKEGNAWIDLGKEKTSGDGRVVFNVAPQAGIYKLKFQIEDYYKKQKVEHFFLNTKVVFQVSDVTRKYHVPLLINPFGYSTYRGS
jgi:5-hydroxyisourate hydrolase